MAKVVHPSLLRLLECAQLATQHSRNPVREFHHVQDKMGVSSAVMTNWKRRGISKEGAISAESLFGCQANWLLTGERSPEATISRKYVESEHWTPSQRPLAGGNTIGEPVAQFLSLPSRSDPPFVSWEDLMAQRLPALFRITLPDNALSPDLVQGDELTIDTSLQPAAGDVVLVRDLSGNHYARMYRFKRPGEWSAQPLNPAFEPLDAVHDALTIVGVCVSETRMRRRSSSSN